MEKSHKYQYFTIFKPKLFFTQIAFKKLQTKSSVIKKGYYSIINYDNYKEVSRKLIQIYIFLSSTGLIMKLRTLRQFYVQPKNFHSIGFHHRGEYAIQIALKQQQTNKKVIFGYPTIVSNAQKKDSTITFIKKKAIFQTEKFKIQNNDQSHTLKNGCLFKIQHLNDNNLTYLQFTLIYFGQEQTSENKVGETVSTCRLIINLNVEDQQSIFSSFQKVVFNTQQFFSCVHIFVEHVRVFTKIRVHNYQLTQFQSFPEEVKNDHILTTRKFINQQIIQLNCEIFGCKSTEEVYKLLILDAVKEYNRTKNMYHKLTTLTVMHSKSGKLHNQEKKTYAPISLDYIITENVSLEALKKKYETKNTQHLYYLLYIESMNIGKNVKKVWQYCIETVLRMQPMIFIKNVSQSQDVKIKFAARQFQLLQVNQQGTRWEDLVLRHKNTRQQALKTLKFYFEDMKTHPLLMVSRQTIIKQGKNVIQHITLNSHQILTVFVHGYGGNQYDMSRMKSHLCHYFNSNFYVIKSIQQRMDADIVELAKLMANELIQYLSVRPTLKRINFVGFSLGGLIVRACLPYLQDYKSKINLVITFATPHLGTTEVSHCIIQAGMKILHRKSLSMKQLTLKDKQKQVIKTVQVTTLGKLSRCVSLGWIKHLIVVGSLNDYYVPSYSSLLDYDGQNNDVKFIQNNIETRVRIIHRINVWFDAKQTIMDKLMKRKHHVAFVQDDSFLDFFFGRHWKLF